MKNTILEVTGMTCGHCEQHVRRALEAVEGVRQAEVSRESARATVSHEPSVDPQRLVQAVVQAGYTAAVAG